ncbi:maleylpyruvate isomerase N-terminal domain-containing protein [Frankia sp. Cppng1_Ct_nod]|uniref:maleylpyruvate isomerase N-terminal domain-containing protein n=1 Tax=Frankia sp. Cppng1_Ct_nod TaxID=2897162 RepID=UPI001040ED5B|nr:maleylpyruvate isomerase N-terminal domain-containing protein [Frankia sp. Cppng1_Ct_nod]
MTGMAAGPVPHAWIAGCRASHRGMAEVTAAVTDARAHLPSLLPGWTVGHLLTHLARNADANTGMVTAACQGGIRPMYLGGATQRDGDIEAGSGRSAAALGEDLRSAVARLEAAWSTADKATWVTGVGLRHGRVLTLADLVVHRWREVEVHLVDLGLVDLGGPAWDGLAADYVDAEWELTLRDLGPRLPERTTVVLAPGDRPSRAFGAGAETGAGDERIVIEAPVGRILQWLTGRGGEESWPDLRPWF